MKRTALIYLTAIYLLSLVGIGVNRFYCCGKLSSVTLTYASADHTDKDNCCKNETKSFKLKDNHITTASFVFSDLSPVIIPTPLYLTFIAIATEQVNHSSYEASAPPGDPDIPIYTLNCAYRI
ncbi:HYC_CC_PP family protein [Mucilaginibacter pankratovii]